MIKKITLLAFVSLMLMSATTLFAQKSTSVTTSVSVETKVTTLKPENFQDMAADLLGKEVEIQGMVVHVCKHGGKKMFIIGEDPDMRVKITASDKVSVFEPELEGSIVHVKGVVEPMDEAETVAAEAEAEGNEDADHKNYYHKPQFSISCLAVREIKE